MVRLGSWCHQIRATQRRATRSKFVLGHPWPLTLVSQSAAASTSCPTGAEISASAFWGNAHGRRRHNARMRTPPTLPSVIGPTRSAEMNQWEAGVVVIRLPLGAPPTATGAALDFAGAEAPARSGETAPFVPSNGDGVCLQRT